MGKVSGRGGGQGERTHTHTHTHTGSVWGNTKDIEAEIIGQKDVCVCVCVCARARPCVCIHVWVGEIHGNTIEFIVKGRKGRERKNLHNHETKDKNIMMIIVIIIIITAIRRREKGK